MRKEATLFMDRWKVQAKLIAIREVITVTFFLSLFWTTVNQVSSGVIDIGAAVLVITYAFTILTGIYELSDSLDEHDDLVDKIIPAFEVLERTNYVTDPLKPIPLTEIKGHISFNDVSFSYIEKEKVNDVFTNFSLDIPAGQKLGIVGLSGAGKSTLTKLLVRFEDVNSGSITIDGINLKDVSQNDLRKAIAYVPQEPLLFHTSVKENIRFSRPNATDKEIWKAAEAAHALHFIQSLPVGIDSVVGERGVKLSGGQKQRIAIARAVLQNAKIVILDEATSALDSESEQIIKSSFSQILAGKTAIVVAHRLSTLSEMDRIVVVDKGRVIEDGTHHSLLKRGGTYGRLWEYQRLYPEQAEIV